jgi:hypothetical protein
VSGSGPDVEWPSHAPLPDDELPDDAPYEQLGPADRYLIERENRDRDEHDSGGDETATPPPSGWWAW